jgi:hypothetical protein
VATASHELALVPEKELRVLPELPSSSTATHRLHAAGCASPFWVSAAVVPLLGVQPERPGVAAGRTTYYNAEHFPASQRHRFHGDLAAAESIPLTWRGLAFSAEGGLRLQQEMRRRGLRAPHWLPAEGLEAVLGMRPLAGAPRVTADGMEMVHVADTEDPALFDASRCRGLGVGLASKQRCNMLAARLHWKFLVQNGLRADDATATWWATMDVLRCVLPAAEADRIAGAESRVRQAAWGGCKWANVSDIKSERLWAVLRHRPRFVEGCDVPPVEQHIALAVEAQRLGLLGSGLWAPAGLVDKRRHAVLGSAAVSGQTMYLVHVHGAERFAA